MARVVYIRLTVGAIRQEWCDRCLTSARVVFGIYRLADDGPRLLATHDRCQRCDVEGGDE